MIEVEQRYDFDCTQACLASIFECDYDDAPVLWDIGELTERPDWLFRLNGWLKDRGFALQNFHHTKGDRPQRSPWMFVGYWLGGVFSPRFDDPRHPGEPGGHTVVMRGADLAWDPSPRRDMGHLGFYNADVFMPIDPSKLVVKS